MPRTTPDDDALIVRLAAQKRRPTNAQIITRVFDRFRTTVSERTVRRRCLDAGVPTSSMRPLA